MVRKKVEQDNRTVSLTPNDSDIRKHLDKLTIPFATYVKELIRKDMNKSVLDNEFKYSLKNEILGILKDALNDIPSNKEVKLIKDLKQMLMQDNQDDMFRSDKEDVIVINPNDMYNGFKIVNKDNKIEVVEAQSNIVKDVIDNNVDETIDEDSVNEVSELFDLKNRKE